MPKSIRYLLIAVLLGIAPLGMLHITLGQGAADLSILNSETQGENRREIQGPSEGNGPEQPNIGFIDSPSATCYQPDRALDECYLSWYYLAVDAAPNYMITMTLTLNESGPIAHTQGFFQTSMYIPYNMLGNGFKVSCGALGSGGNPLLGKAYAYTVRARDSAGLKGANYGTVYCPAYTP
jgi:hypothetical protein